MNKTSKVFIHRSRLKNNFNKKPTIKNKQLYKIQRNLCVNLLYQEKRNYNNNLDVKLLQDNKTFWRYIKPLFSDKNPFVTNDIILAEGNSIISDKYEVAKKLNDYFIDTVENLDIENYIQYK